MPDGNIGENQAGGGAKADFFPVSAFYFSVSGLGTDSSFQEVSGISSEMGTEEYHEGGENRFRYALPTGVTHPKLVLKRGIEAIDSPLVKWCKDVLEGDLVQPIKPRSIYVKLLDGKGDPLRAWSFGGAYPVKWEVDGFHSTKNEVAIESIELSYTYSYRTK
jgi:phage tail-like protein